MYDTLRDYINKYAPSQISDEDFEAIKSKFVPAHYGKNQHLLQEGEVCRLLIFIGRGAVRQYSIDAKGAEHIINLCTENWWVGDRQSFTMLTPTPYNITAVEDTDVLLLSKAHFDELLSTTILASVFRNLDYNNQVATLKRINASLSLTAEQRYRQLAEANPDLLQRFPQHMIASFLGVSPETISRVRSKAR